MSHGVLEVTSDCQELAALVAEKIRSEPTSHHQATWALFLADDVKENSTTDEHGRVLVNCNTTGCVCGWASMMSGDYGIINGSIDEVVLPGKEDADRVYSIGRIVTPEGRMMDIEDRGQSLLCMDDESAGWMFSPFRARAEVLYALQELSDGHPISCREDFTLAEREELESPRIKTPEPAPELQLRKARVEHVKANTPVTASTSKAATIQNA